MTDREKVIKALENCNAPEKCRDCPWEPCEEFDCKHSDYPDGLIGQAIALLKAQEPRVMTLEEYKAWIGTPFTKRNPVFHEERTKRGTVTCWVNTTICTLREYGKNDRCWTSRPTDEQREAAKWE